MVGRDWPGWRGVMAAGAVLALAGAGFLLWRLSAFPTSPASTETVATDALAARGGSPPPPDSGVAMRTVVVFVNGAVLRPGTYRLAAGLRVADALAAAGGATPDADPDRMPNVAAKLTDGKQVKIPRLHARAGAAATKLDINTAALAELEAVPGMPPGLAQQIVDFRDQYGSFGSLTELRTELGVDTVTLATLRRYLAAG